MFRRILKSLNVLGLKERKKVPQRRFQPRLEQLEDRLTPAVLASFDASLGLLTVSGDTLANNMTLTKNAAGSILLNGSPIAGAPTLTNTSEISVLGDAGNDTFTNKLTSFTGTLTFDGGAGTDNFMQAVSGVATLTDVKLTVGAAVVNLAGLEKATLTGSAGPDTLDASACTVIAVTLNGAAGDDTLKGGAKADTLTGGSGNDLLQGGAGNDVYVFKTAVGTETDTVVENTNAGTDRLDFAGLGASDGVIANLTNDQRLATHAGRTVKTGTAGMAANFENVTGGAGNDRITGNAAANRLVGNGGVDTAYGGGAGADIFSAIETILTASPAPVASADAAILDEDTALTLNVLANDTDPDNDALSAVIVAGPANGSVQVHADGTLTYTPASNFFGRDSFTYQARDSFGNLSAPVTVNLTINPVDDDAAVLSALRDGANILNSLTDEFVHLNLDLDLPMVDEDLVDALGLEDLLKDAFTLPDLSGLSLDEAKAVLAQAGFIVHDAADSAANDLLRVTWRPVLTGSGTFNLVDLNSADTQFEYFDGLVTGNLSANAMGSTPAITLEMTFGVDLVNGQPQFFLAESSHLQVGGLTFSAHVTGDLTIKFLPDVHVEADLNANLDGALTLQDNVDGIADGKLRLPELQALQGVTGRVHGSVELNDPQNRAQFTADMPSMGALTWYGWFKADIDTDRVEAIAFSWDLDEPSATDLIGSLVGNLFNFGHGIPFLDQVNDLIDYELPVFDETVGEAFGLDFTDDLGWVTNGVAALDTVGKTLDEIGVALQRDYNITLHFNSGNYVDQIQKVIKGERIDILSFEAKDSAPLLDVNESIPLGAFLIGPIPVTVNLDLGAHFGWHYFVGLGVDTAGFWIDPNTNIGLDAGVRAGIGASVGVGGLLAVNLSVGAGFNLSAGIGLNDPDPSDGRIYMDEILHSGNFLNDLTEILRFYANGEGVGYIRAEIDLPWPLPTITLVDAELHIGSFEIVSGQDNHLAPQPTETRTYRERLLGGQTPPLTLPIRTETDGSRTLLIHGDDTSDRVTLSGRDRIVHVAWAGHGSGQFTDIDRVEFLGAGGDDVLRTDSDFNIPIIARGGDGNDSLQGGEAGDYLYGEGDHDTLDGREADDWLSGDEAGQAGNDILTGGDGADHLLGGDGQDTISGGQGSDELDGGAGDDVLQGGSEDDRLFGQAGADQLIGHAGNDHLYGGADDDALMGDDVAGAGGGQDQLFGEAGSDRLFGGGGDDTLLGDDTFATDGAMVTLPSAQAGADVLQGGAGNDLLFGNNGNDTLNGGAGQDVEYGDDANKLEQGEDRFEIDFSSNEGAVVDDFHGGLLRDYVLITGFELPYWNEEKQVFEPDQRQTEEGWVPVTGHDEIVISQVPAVSSFTAGWRERDSGQAFTEVTFTLPGDVDAVIVNARGGDDLVSIDPNATFKMEIYGGAGNDELHGGGGDDKIYGSDFQDTDAGADHLYGHGGEDELHGGQGADHLFGGDQSDVLYGEDGDDTMDGEAGHDTQYGGKHNDTMRAGTGFLGDVMFGQDGDDWLYGGDGLDVLDGGNHSDHLYGGMLGDVLMGGADIDYLFGQEGIDILMGDAGNDFLSAGDSATQEDWNVAFNRLHNREIDIFGIHNHETLPDYQGLLDEINARLSEPTIPPEEVTYLSRQHDELLNELGYIGAQKQEITNNAKRLTEGTSYEVAVPFTEILIGGADDDELRGSKGADWLVGGDDNDTIYHSKGVDTYQGGAGASDTFVVQGTDQADTVDFIWNDATGGFFAQINGVLLKGDRTEFENFKVETLAGDDMVTLAGLAAHVPLTGKMIVDGGADDDTIDARSYEAPIDLYGSAGNDTLYGGLSNDTLYGGDGDDRLDGGPGQDYLNATGAQPGNDRLYYSDGLDTYDGSGSQSERLVYRGQANDSILVFARAFEVNNGTSKAFKEFNAIGIDEYQVEYGGPNISARVATLSDVLVSEGYWQGTYFWQPASVTFGWVDRHYVVFTVPANGRFSFTVSSTASWLNMVQLCTLDINWGDVIDGWSNWYGYDGRHGTHYRGGQRLFFQSYHMFPWDGNWYASLNPIVGWEGNTLVIRYEDGGDSDYNDAVVRVTAEVQIWNPYYVYHPPVYDARLDLYGLYTGSLVTNEPTLIDVPEDIVVDATDLNGAVVHYTMPTAYYGTEPSPTVVTSHPSGSLFPIGTTVVSLTAQNSAGIETTATFEVTVLETMAPEAPEPLVAKAASTTQIDLSWSNVAGERGYDIWQWEVDAWKHLANVGVDVTGYSVTDLNPSSTYRFMVGAFNNIGTTYTDYQQATTSAPAAPDPLVATLVSPTQVDLSWTNVAEEDGYDIWKWDGIALTHLATVGADVTFYSVTDLNPLSTYFFVVGAFNSIGTTYTGFVRAI